jgi:hypothetical protein
VKSTCRRLLLASRGHTNTESLTCSVHVCKDPFFNNHKFIEKEQKTSPLRFICDGCNHRIASGNRHSCAECASTLGSGGYDLCESCLGLGKHCPGKSHSLEKIPIFEFGDCIHVNARTCKDCHRVPLFPTDRPVKNFKAIRLESYESRGSVVAFTSSENPQTNPSSCDDFVAVSYCWPPPKLDNDGNPLHHSGQYTVKSEDGLIRQNRAPEEVLDRAVAFASQNGLRLIWIDQV